MSLRCRACNAEFNDKVSIEVHYLYAHSGDQQDDSRSVEPDAESVAATATTTAESNNNHHFFKYQNPPENVDDTSIMTAISPGNAENREFHLPSAVQHRGDLLYDIPSSAQQQQQQQQAQQNYENFVLNSSQEYSRSSPVIQNAGGYTFSEQRYHPYYKQGFREVQRHMPPALPMPRCDKCDQPFTTQEHLLHHYNVAHGTVLGLGIQFHPRFGNAPIVNGGGGAEPQAEILDLDSHKVHVYQPPNGEDSQDSDHRSMDPWGQDESKKYFHQQQLQINQQNGGNVQTATNGRGGTPLPSPDFGNVSTTTENIENLQSSTRSPYYEQNSGVNSTPTQSSTDNPTGRSSSKAGKNSNGSWKSNEARRPKTYNCSACNKWFTSSGHLKRHYNTTLHKNAVKQSGVADPATLPVSAHHHPQKDPSFSSSRQVKNSPPTEAETPPSKPDTGAGYAARNSQLGGPPPTNAFLHNSPNLMAGPSDVPGGLLHPSYTQSPPDLKSPSPITSLQQPPPPHSNHTNYLGFGVTQPTTLQFFQQPTPTTLYPNSQSPHVSTTLQVTTNNLTGNLNENDVLIACSDDKLPSFACIHNNTVVWNAEQFLSTLDNGNVGGPFSPKEVETATHILLTNLNVGLKIEPVSGVILESVAEPFSNEQLSQPPTEQITETKEAEILQQEDTNVSSSTERASPTTTEADKQVFSCEQCHKFFNKACYLTQHNKSFHSGFKPFKCARCGKRFLDNVQFKIHSDKHAGDKPYKCEICPKAFNHKTDLRRHACLHTNQRPYNCDICSKGFIRKDHMLKHRDTHQNRKSSQRKYKVDKLKKELELMAEISC